MTKEICYVNDSGYSYLDATIDQDKVTIRQNRIESGFDVQVGELTIQQFLLKISNENWQDCDEVETECKIIAGEGTYF
jgi:hypothetical protein